MDNEPKQYLEGMEARLMARTDERIAVNEAHLTRKLDERIAETEAHLIEKMRDMQTELLRGFESFSSGQTIPRLGLRPATQ